MLIFSCRTSDKTLLADVKKLTVDICSELAQKPPSELCHIVLCITPPSNNIDRTRPQDMSGLAVSALMMTYTPFAVISNPTTTVDWKTYLKGGELWVAIKEYAMIFGFSSNNLKKSRLLTKIKAHITSPGQIVEGDFAVVEALLLNLGEITISTAKEMLALIKLAAYIHRPYSGRTAALVKTIYSVDQISRQDKNKALSGHRHRLKLWVLVVFCPVT